MIAVDEKGTEAAAVTDSGLREVSAIEATPVEFRADRPFLFVIDDPSTGAILFLGRLARPRSSGRYDVTAAGGRADCDRNVTCG